MVSALFTCGAQSSSLYSFSFRSICYSSSLPIPQTVFRSFCFSIPARPSSGNFDLKESMFQRWHWHWQCQTASLFSLAHGLSSFLTGLEETAAIPLPRIGMNKLLSTDHESELLFLDQCIATALVLGVICSLTNIFQLTLQEIFGHGFSVSTFYAQREFLCRFLYMYLAKIHGSHAHMPSICSSLGPLGAHRRHSNSHFLVFLHSNKNIGFVSPVVYCSNNESTSHQSQAQLGYDPSEELLVIEADLNPTLMLSENENSCASKPKSWFGPNGQYIKELPCPSCRGRGYTPCTECGIERSRLDCSQCSGKGIITCHQCLGECVIWEESIDEQPWEKARSISPLVVKEDDEVDNLEIKLDKKKSKRVYQSPRPEVGQKISRSLKSLNAKTGLFSKRMKIIHRNPVLRAQRAAAIKKAKGTPAARKHTSETLKAYFSDPENRHKRSLAMKGVKYFCKNCGREGHRRHYCPEIKEDRRFRCRLCGEKGHNKRTCPRSKISSYKSTGKRSYHCSFCHGKGHNRRTCPKLTEPKSGGSNMKKSWLISNRRIYKCLSCGEQGHNVRTCAHRKAEPVVVTLEY